MKSFDLNIFHNAQKNSVEGLILGLAMAYNDAKDIIWMSQLLDDYSPEDKKAINEESGQWRAMNHFVTKSILANIHQTIVLLASNSGILNSLQFKELEKKLSGFQKEIWLDLKSVALNKYQTSPLKKKLSAIRDKVVHHYDSKDLLSKIKQSRDVYDGPGYVSIGRNMEQTRFYFADLTFDVYKKEFGLSEKEINHLFRDVNSPIHFLIKQFLAKHIS